MQKKLLLATTLILSACICHAQVQKGDWLLGGSFGFSGSTNTSSGNYTNTGSNSNLQPELGLAIGKNSVVGLRGSFYYVPTKTTGGNKQVNFNYLVGGFWKKFFPINKNTGWYTDAEVGYSYSKYKYTYAASPAQDFNSTGRGFSAVISPGMYYKPSGKIMLHAGLGGLTYNYSKASSTSSGSLSSDSNSYFNLTLLNYYTFGISFIISKDQQM